MSELSDYYYWPTWKLSKLNEAVHRLNRDIQTRMTMPGLSLHLAQILLRLAVTLLEQPQQTRGFFRQRSFYVAGERAKMSSPTGWAASCGLNVISRVTRPSLCGVSVIWLNLNWDAVCVFSTLLWPDFLFTSINTWWSHWGKGLKAVESKFAG